MIHLEEITSKNKQEVLDLHVKNNQDHYVETVEESLHDAELEKQYLPLAIYDDQTLIGFTMVGFFKGEGENKTGRVWLDRLLIDKSFQGQGFGKKSMESIINYLVNKYSAKEIYLSVYDNNVPAISMYKKFGFDFNGELDINKEKVMVKKIGE